MGGPESSSGRDSAELPQQFGDYSILGHLATGGMAEVYVARKKGIRGFEKIVVIKRVRPELLADGVSTTNFLDEARLVATLEHPNIAQVYEVGSVNGNYFFVMEYVDGADLRQLMAEASRSTLRISYGDAVYIAIHVCAALHYAHEKCDADGHPLNIIHRDVTPSNVLISHSGGIKVCDFGIAKAHGRTLETARGTLKGKFAYMSPEQCRCQSLDRRSDVFAIGIVLYELTTTTRLFHRDTDFETLRAIVDEQVPLPSSRVTDYPKDLERIVMRALEKDPAKRYPDAEALQLELEAFAREHKLAMSSINIAKLISGLFEKGDAWARAKREQVKELEEQLDTTVRPPNEPAFFPIGSGSTDVDIKPAFMESITPMPMPTPTPTVPQKYPGAMRVHTPTPTVYEHTPPAPRPVRRPAIPIVPPFGGAGTAVGTVATPLSTMPVSVIATPRRRPSLLWLIAAFLAAVAAAGSIAYGRQRAEDADDKRALGEAADRIASLVDSTARGARARIDNLALTPMLRAAIDTDAATIKDVVEQEGVFTVGKGETLEVFQLRGGASVSVYRLPLTASALPTVDAGETRMQADGQDLDVVASAAVHGTRGIAGVIALRVPVDLTPAKHALGNRVAFASVSGAGADVVLTGAAHAEGKQLSVAIPTSDPGARSLSLIAVSQRSARKAAWLRPVRDASIGLAALFLLVYTVGLVGVLRPSKP